MMPMRHALSHALSVILPGQNENLLLRACLVDGESGRRACENWLRNHEDPKASLTTEFAKSFLPLLLHTLRNHSIEVTNPFLTILRTAALREELRTQTYRRICRRVLSVLQTNQIPAILIKGAILGETVYPDPSLRHSHDIEIVIKRPNLPEVARLLVEAGFVSSGNSSRSDFDNIELVHDSGLPLVLHHNLFDIPFYNAAFPEICLRAQTTFLWDIPVQVLSPADALLYTCGHAAYSVSHESHRWISDAWFIVDRHRDLDWELLLKTATDTHLALPLSVTLAYLAEELNAPIPLEFLDCLFIAASKTESIGCELALFGARSSPRGGFRNLIREARNWRARMYIIKWMVLPSAAYVRWVSKFHSLWFLPLQYVYRPARYALRFIRPAL